MEGSKNALRVLLLLSTVMLLWYEKRFRSLLYRICLWISECFSCYSWWYRLCDTDECLFISFKTSVKGNGQSRALKKFKMTFFLYSGCCFQSKIEFLHNQHSISEINQNQLSSFDKLHVYQLQWVDGKFNKLEMTYSSRLKWLND